MNIDVSVWKSFQERYFQMIKSSRSIFHIFFVKIIEVEHTFKRNFHQPNFLIELNSSNVLTFNTHRYEKDNKKSLIHSVILNLLGWRIQPMKIMTKLFNLHIFYRKQRPHVLSLFQLLQCCSKNTLHSHFWMSSSFSLNKS